MRNEKRAALTNWQVLLLAVVIGLVLLGFARLLGLPEWLFPYRP